MSGPGKLSIVTLGVADVERSLRFYSALGWVHSTRSVDGVIHWWDLGGPYLGVYEEAALAADSGLGADDVHPPDGAAADRPTSGHGFRGVTLAINLGSAREVDAALARALEAGGRQTLAPTTTEYEVYHACFADPDGHVWEVAWNPGFPIVGGRTVIP